ncbi:GDP dissociation inhibitor [Daldinia caldariorum]|uniref:GDP dissociation inhibitor n=1 Tax=Daldinia caldariorum TaxID=326644 RepID=UPI002008964B|nr:GDP dissociation inhibitor [Daldinia caldariorum]KAI1472552.1 GDP dissociation inhibitor [Daldinia caldariorum]
MESLGDEPWDVVICGTGLQQSLLALALSRSNKRILHVDPNDYYGEHEAAFSLQEADSWAAIHAGRSAEEDSSVEEKDPIFKNASAWKHPDAAGLGLSFPRAYSLALAPQIIHTRSKLLEQLVSSRAYRQVEFLAVGSFFVFDEKAGGEDSSKLARIPSSREDVFATQAIPVKSKRSLMKFLKFVIDYDSEEQRPVWQGQEQKLLSEFLASEFKLSEDLQKYILALTLTLDDRITVADGLASIHRHLTSMGLFGPGFCAVYPKWGGSSEIAQVACRAGAVGGGIYMLDTKAKVGDGSDGREISLELSNGISVRTTKLVASQQDALPGAQTITRLIAVVNTPLKHLFETVVEGAPTPVVAVVAFPSQTSEDSPIYAFVHSSETGECPAGQSVIYLTTLATSQSAQRLESALNDLIAAATPSESPAPVSLYKLQYEQTLSAREPSVTTNEETRSFAFPSPSLSLTFDDGCLGPVKEAWKLVMGDKASETEYMVFQDREGVDDDDDVYD